MNEQNSQTDVDAAARIVRRRSIAIALMLGLMVVLFYAATLVQFGSTLVTKGS